MIWRIVLMLGCLLSLVPLEARAGVQTTTVAGTVYRADGSAAAGTLIVSWPAFTTADGQAVAAGTITVQIGANGAMSVALAPNEGATPAGTYYTAVYHLNDGTVNKEYWLVPQVPNATLAAIRAKVVPAAVAVPVTGTGSVSTVYQLMSTNFLPLGGGTLNGPLTLSGQPTAAGQAASKSYVDTAVGGISAGSLGVLPLTGGTISGDIIAKDGTPVASEAYVAQHASGGVAAASGTLGSVQINNGQGSLGTDSGLTMDTTNHILNIPGQITTGPEENAPRAIYDPMNPKYAGGLAAATTPEQQQAVLQATLDQAACDEHDGKISSAVVLYPAGYTSNISNLMVHSLITFKCSAEGQLFGGGCSLVDSYVNPGTPSATSGAPMIRLDFTNHGMCHGVDTVFGGSQAAVVGFTFFGAGATGGYDEGVRAYDVHNLVAHNSFNNFGGAAIEMDGTPGDGVAEWNFITNSPTYWTQNPSLIPPQAVGALECIGEDTSCHNNEVSTGAPFFRGNWIRPANYGAVAAILVGGGAARIDNNFVQIADIGVIVECCSGGNQINGLRADFLSGAGLYSNAGGNVYSGITINNPCMDPNSVDATSHVSNCAAISDSGGNAYNGIALEPFAGFGASYVGSMFNVTTTGTYTSYTNGYPLDQYGNGADFVNSSGGSFYGLGAPSGAQPATTSCSFSGQTTVDTNGCTHIQLTDTTPISIASFTGLGDGKTITIEGTANDTLLNAAGGYLSAGMATCSGANLTLGHGPLSFFYTTRDILLHQICDDAFNYTSPTFQGSSADVAAVAPVTLLSTTFNEGAAGATVEGTMPVTDTDTPSRPWTAYNGSAWQFVSGGGLLNTAPGAIVTGVPGQKYTISGHISSTNGGATDILFRYVDTENFVYINGTSTALNIGYFVNSGLTVVATASGAADTGDFLVTVNGRSVSATINGVTVSGTLPSAAPTGTLVGFYSESSGMQVSSLTVQSLASPASGGTGATLTSESAFGTTLGLTNNGHAFSLFVKDAGDIFGVNDGTSNLFEATPAQFGSSSAAVLTSGATPASSTPTGGCIANSLWADDNYLYHCSANGAVVKRVALNIF